MSMLQLLGGVAAAGVVAAGTTAFTGTGVSFLGSGTGTSTQYVGGQLVQTVSGGGSIDAVDYTTNAAPAGPAGNQITAIDVTISSADDAYLKITPIGGSLGGPAPTGTREWYCTSAGIVAAVGHASAPKVHLTTGSIVVHCITADSTGHGALGYYSGLTSLQLDVTNS